MGKQIFLYAKVWTDRNFFPSSLLCICLRSDAVTDNVVNHLTCCSNSEVTIDFIQILFLLHIYTTNNYIRYIIKYVYM